MLSDVIRGKGTPAANQVFVILAIKFGFAKPGNLTAFANAYMGLDCSGFVCNYLMSIGKLETHLGSTAFRKKTYEEKRRTDISDVKMGDLLVWIGTNHIAIIDSIPVSNSNHIWARKELTPDPNPDPEYTCTVVESNGTRGLDSEEYSLTRGDGKSFSDGTTATYEGKVVFCLKRKTGKKIYKAIILDWGVSG